MSGVPLPAWMHSKKGVIVSYQPKETPSYKYEEEKKYLYKTYGSNSTTTNKIWNTNESSAIGLLNTKGFCCYWKDMTKPKYLSWGWGSNQWVCIQTLYQTENTASDVIMLQELLRRMSQTPRRCKKVYKRCNSE